MADPTWEEWAAFAGPVKQQGRPPAEALRPRSRGKKAWPRSQVVLTHLHVARYLAANPEALAQVAESMGPEALAALGRALARRVEAIVNPPAA